jgi:hypothetical protein
MESRGAETPAVPDARESTGGDTVSRAEPFETLETADIVSAEIVQPSADLMRDYGSGPTEPDEGRPDAGGLEETELFCAPDCDSKACGPDGCGGSCGACPWELSSQCIEGVCVAQPVCGCDSRECGPDGCGQDCGTCSGDTVCASGMCLVPGQECSDGNDIDWDGCTRGRTTERFVAALHGQCPSGGAVVSTDSGYRVFWMDESAEPGWAALRTIGLSPEGSQLERAKTLVPKVAGDEIAPARVDAAAVLGSGQIVVPFNGVTEPNGWPHTHVLTLSQAGKPVAAPVPLQGVGIVSAVVAAPGGGFVLGAWYYDSWDGECGTEHAGVAGCDASAAEIGSFSLDESPGCLCFTGRPALARSKTDDSILAAWATVGLSTADPFEEQACLDEFLESWVVTETVDQSNWKNKVKYPQSSMNGQASGVGLVSIADGSYVVLWSGCTDQWGSACGVYARPVLSGNKLGGPEWLVFPDTEDQFFHAIETAWTGGASWVAAWNVDQTSEMDPDEEVDILVVAKPEDPTPVTGPIQANVYEPGKKELVGVASPGDGSYLVAWCSCGHSPNGGCGMFTRVFEVPAE